MKNMIGETFSWTGVVEDRNDPQKLGRVKVRIFGLHSESIDQPNFKTGEGCPVDSLPWAQVLQPANSGSMNGVSNDGLGLVEGSWVIGISRDGRACQDIIVIGSLNGAPDKLPDARNGFMDHEDTVPVTSRPKRPQDTPEHYPKSNYLKEPDINRLARNEKINETIVKTKKDSIVKGVAVASGGTWDEPANPYAAEYPYNHVSESESGHIIERDDTPGAERTHDYHRSGTFEEVHPDGTKVTKVVKDAYEIIFGDNYVHINGTCNITVGGSANIQVDGTTTLKTPNAIIDSGHIELGKGATENLVLGNTFKTFLNSFFSVFNSHTHTGNLGQPTTPPTSSATNMSDSQLSQNNTFTL